MNARLRELSRCGQGWVERQDPRSPSGVAIDAWRRYRAVDGPLQSVLLSTYILVAVLPALLVMEEYLDPQSERPRQPDRPPLPAQRLRFGADPQRAGPGSLA